MMMKLLKLILKDLYDLNVFFKDLKHYEKIKTLYKE